jgi:hypothetical protein
VRGELALGLLEQDVELADFPAPRVELHLATVELLLEDGVLVPEGVDQFSEVGDLTVNRLCGLHPAHGVIQLNEARSWPL